MAEDKPAASKKFRKMIPAETREHLQAARAEMRKGLKTLFPASFFQHRQNARRESLLALRSLIDGLIDRMESQD